MTCQQAAAPARTRYVLLKSMDVSELDNRPGDMLKRYVPVLQYAFQHERQVWPNILLHCYNRVQILSLSHMAVL